MNIIDGKKIAGEIKEELKKRVEKLKEKKIIPYLAVILVGNDFASQKYVASKQKTCEALGIKSDTIKLQASTTEDELLRVIKGLNQDELVDGILVQLPLPKHINEGRILESILPSKDVDGFHPMNVGRLLLGDPELLPCTPNGIMHLLDSCKVKLRGKNCVVVGRSNIVGKPISALLLSRDATVTIAHSKTEDLKSITKKADVLVVAVGKKGLITKDMIKDDVVIIDVGINRAEDGTISGDVVFDECSKKASYITPVPGGVGPMTIAMLMKNCITIAEKRAENIQD